MKRVLIVEDEYAIRDMIAINLKMAGYDVAEAPSGERGVQLLNDAEEPFDIAVLDVMLPGMSGFELCSYIRERYNSTGIIILSARTQEYDKVKGLGLGADDYISKPFGTNELLARIDAVYRRTHHADSSAAAQEIKSGDFTLDVVGRRLLCAGKPVELTQVEFMIMELFLNNIGAALTRERIMTAVWGENYYGELKIVDVNIRRLRVKLKADPGNPVHIMTVWGYGYRWSE